MTSTSPKTFGFEPAGQDDIQRRAMKLTVFIFIVAAASFLAGAGAAFGSVALVLKGIV